MVPEDFKKTLEQSAKFGGYHEDWRQADVVCGGFPCQDVSNSGDGAGITGSRSGLWGYMVGAIRLVRPKYAVMENVAGLLSNGMDTVLGDLAESGYDSEWDCIPTGLNFGHVRNRVFIVANLVCEGLQKRRDTNHDSVNEKSLFTRERFAGIFKDINPGEKWLNRPLLGRGISRVPNRTHRIRGLGNAVVPQVVEAIGRSIMKAELELKNE